MAAFRRENQSSNESIAEGIDQDPEGLLYSGRTHAGPDGGGGSTSPISDALGRFGLEPRPLPGSVPEADDSKVVAEEPDDLVVALDDVGMSQANTRVRVPHPATRTRTFAVESSRMRRPGRVETAQSKALRRVRLANLRMSKSIALVVFMRPPGESPDGRT